MIITDTFNIKNRLEFGRSTYYIIMGHSIFNGWIIMRQVLMGPLKKKKSIVGVVWIDALNYTKYRDIP